jgi:hypothetical protein
VIWVELEYSAVILITILTLSSDQSVMICECIGGCNRVFLSLEEQYFGKKRQRTFIYIISSDEEDKVLV